MQDLKPTELMTVVGGTKQNDQITQQLTTLQSSLKDLTSSTSNTNGCGGNNTFMMLAMMMAMRPQPTVVAGGCAPAVAASGPVINVNTRVRHW